MSESAGFAKEEGGFFVALDVKGGQFVELVELFASGDVSQEAGLFEVFVSCVVVAQGGGFEIDVGEVKAALGVFLCASKAKMMGGLFPLDGGSDAAHIGESCVEAALDEFVLTGLAEK